MKILLVEDTQRHIDAAKSQLSEHELTIVTGFDQAREELGLRCMDTPRHDNYGLEVLPFDVLLTDVMLPKGGSECMGPEGQELAEQQGPMPYGPIIALHAIQRGIKRVGILTDGNHHSDPFIFAFDNLKGFQIADVRVVCSNEYVILGSSIRELIKDWAKLLEMVVNGIPDDEF